MALKIRGYGYTATTKSATDKLTTKMLPGSRPEDGLLYLQLSLGDKTSKKLENKKKKRKRKRKIHFKCYYFLGKSFIKLKLKKKKHWKKKQFN